MDKDVRKPSPRWLQNVIAHETRRRTEEDKDKAVFLCRFCTSVNLRPLIDNGVHGDGYLVKEWVCRDCGAVQ